MVTHDQLKMTGYADAKMAPPPPTQTSAISKTNSRLETAQANAAMLEDRLDRVISRAFGTPVSGATSPSVAPVPSGSLGYTEELLDKLERALGAISAQIFRIDEIV